MEIKLVLTRMMSLLIVMSSVNTVQYDTRTNNYPN
jgi:hypothetical protein